MMMMKCFCTAPFPKEKEMGSYEKQIFSKKTQTVMFIIQNLIHSSANENNTITATAAMSLILLIAIQMMTTVMTPAMTFFLIIPVCLLNCRVGFKALGDNNLLYY